MRIPRPSELIRLFRDGPAPSAVRSAFEGASGRRAAGFGRAFGSHGPETLAAGPTLRPRARSAHANNPLVRNAVDAFVAETVGAGIEAISAHPDPAMAETISGAFYAAELDADGRTDFRGMTAAAVLAVLVDGEAFFVAERRDGRTVWRHIPAEFVDESDTRELSDGYVVAGIEFANDGTRRAYHVRPQRPTDLFPGTHASIRVPAEDMLHVFRPLGPGQVRGVSALAPILSTLSEYGQSSDALLVKLKATAMHVAFITDVNGTAASAYDAAGIGEEGLSPGTVYRLGIGEDVRTAFPDAAQDAPAFLKTMRQQIAAGLGVPTHLLDGDLSDANYSSLRAGLLPFRAKVEQFVYHTLVPQFLDPIFRRFVTDEYLAGRLDLPDLAPALKAEWLPPRHAQVDPQKDMAAAETALRLGLTSRRQAVAQMGWNVAELDSEIAADRAREAGLGLSFSTGGDDAV
ncbi:phage portal protein [Roseisalinus antarcticus]|uniref:Phage portal protein, lambda family n=1 Tax=Roseisalinus antarcticus TaxID=254357 RepID=A0A1Y5TZV4_9RHOB|nr:phage portal protein [Roseisalinus antarcticus]SLN77702.1 Phage portal protein, lambda family [Roseisalinus antarcticus]